MRADRERLDIANDDGPFEQPRQDLVADPRRRASEERRPGVHVHAEDERASEGGDDQDRSAHDAAESEL